MEITVLKDILGVNKETASDIKDILKENNIYMIDLMSSPGSGKTTLAYKIISALKDRYKIAVIEGDVETAKDAERLAVLDVPVVQIETNHFGGDCHLESSWIKKCFNSFNLKELDFIIVENIGNLVCPAEFELGDDERIVVLSITEGEDKPVKYPLVFNTSKTLLLNKMDLLPYLDFDMDELYSNIKKVNPNLDIFEVSGTKDTGIDAFIDHLVKNIEDKKKSNS
jgi:hydrogenase nickel incorporation protein HypB